MVIIKKHNNTFLSLFFDNPKEKQKIYNAFSFNPPDYRFNPKYRQGFWDGKIRLLKANRYLYLGLYKRLINYLKKQNIEYKIDENSIKKVKINKSHVQQYIKNIESKIPDIDNIRDYQENLVVEALYNNRLVTISATGSGKSLSIYLYIKYLLDNDILNDNDKILLVVPRVDLVFQMESDFIKYDSNIGTIKHQIHKIFAEQQKNDHSKKIYISTWNSIYELPVEYFSQFSVLVWDEVHRVKAKCSTQLCEKCENAYFRLGLTGTLDENEVDKDTNDREIKTSPLVFEGLIGPIVVISDTDDLIKRNYLSDLLIYNVIMKYPIEDKILCQNFTYQEELKFALKYHKRTQKIVELVTRLENNTLILFKRINYGKTLFQNLEKNEKLLNKKIFYIDGQTPTNTKNSKIIAEKELKDRQFIKLSMESSNNVIIVASSQIFSEGVNIPNLHNLILTMAGKSKINVIQSIGRGLRKHPTKKLLRVFDIIDDFQITNDEKKEYKHLNLSGKINYLKKHYHIRKKFYDEKKFKYVEKTINL